MIRIVGVQRGQTASEEFVLVQNQGSLRVNLRGHALLAEDTMTGGNGFALVLCDEAVIMPGQYAVLRSGIGPSRWNKCADGSSVYYTYLGHNRTLWDGQDNIHLLAPQHTYSERRVDPIVVC
jgi:hypothetical protein